MSLERLMGHVSEVFKLAVGPFQQLLRQRRGLEKHCENNLTYDAVHCLVHLRVCYNQIPRLGIISFVSMANATITAGQIFHCRLLRSLAHIVSISHSSVVIAGRAYVLSLLESWCSFLSLSASWAAF